MTDLRFYVLTPTYNRAERVVRAVESVLNQKYDSWEMFVYDDGSSDDTAERLKPFEQDDRIHIWHGSENLGANYARNFLLERILERDEPGMIAILDDDDGYVPDALARMAEEYAKTSRKWMIARCHTEDGISLTHWPRAGDIDYVQDHKFGRGLRGEVAHFFHTSAVGDARFLTLYPNAEEWYFYYALGREEKMWAVEFEAVEMEYLDTGLSRSQPNFEHKAELYRLKLERLGPDAHPKLRARLLAKRARQLLQSGQRKAGLAELARGFATWPLEPRLYQFFVQQFLPNRLGGFLGRAVG